MRKTADPCLLVQSLLDLGVSLTVEALTLPNMTLNLVVDAALEVVDEYRTRLSVVERMILIKSKVKNVRSRPYSFVQLTD